jgi:hypothetical protein
MKRVVGSIVTVISFGLVMALAGCNTGDTGPAGATGATGTSGAVTNATCLAANCHGNASLTKTIVNDQGNPETVPLYVDETQFAVSVHKGQLCVSCHNDINAAGGAHGLVDKTYGGWARFSRSQAVEDIPKNMLPRTRNYYTAAARSCVTCHPDQGEFKYSAHATIFKQRAAHIDTELTAIATAEEGKPTTIGEDYMVGNCNRCHASCATCHFKSSISLKGAYPVADKWDEIQRTDKIDGASVPDNLSEYQMDWTTNVRSHEFRTKAYFATDAEGVCEACHTGYNRPAINAYYWIDKASNEWAKVKAGNVRRHPQATELAISGDTSLSITGGTNPHALFACADCHGTASGASGNIHNLPGMPYSWSEKGDVQCTTCHSGYATNHWPATLPFHSSVACVGCHTFGLGRDFMFASGAPVDNTADVFIDPVTKQVRPVVRKNGHAIAWYSHNWQILDIGSGFFDNNSGCAKKCHYDGNVVGAGAW